MKTQSVTYEEELFKEIHQKEQIVAPKAGALASMKEFMLSDMLIEQPIVRRRCYFQTEWSHINVARAKRPFSTAEFAADAKGTCFFCPGSEDKTPRDAQTGEDFISIGNPWTLRVFPNLYPWLLHHLNIVETNTHKAKLADLSFEEELDAVRTGAKITADFEKKGLHTMFFRNQGSGASLPHYHWQIGALPYIPEREDMELKAAKAFSQKYGVNLFDAILDAEREKDERFIAEDDLFGIIAPFAPRTNLETWIISKKPASSLTDFSDDEMKVMVGHLCKYLKMLYDKTSVDCLFIICHQLKAEADFRLHWEIFPIKPWSSAERGFYEFVVEVSPENTAALLKS